MIAPAGLAAIHAACFTSQPQPWSQSAFEALLDDPTVFLITEPQALILGRAVAGEAELLTLAVAPAARRRGLARKLLTDFETMAHARKADIAFLEVAEDNMPARALYASAGWVEVGRRPRYYGPVTALILRKEIGG